MKKILFLSIISFFSILKAQNFTKYVDPYIGSGGHGHVFVGASVPFGLIQAGPTQPVRGWDWCSGYHFSGDTIVGFSQQHLSGTGIGDLGDITIMPVVNAQVDLKSYSWIQTFSHDNECVRPGYYSVKLPSASVEITASEFSAFYRIEGTPFLVLNLYNAIGWDSHVDSNLKQVDDFTLVGHRLSRGWADKQCVWFAIHFSNPVSILSSENNIWLLDVGCQKYECSISIGYETSDAVNIPKLNFDEALEQAISAWNRQLSHIRADFSTERERTIFYTSLYHYMIQPSVYHDRNGNPSLLTTFSLWDTYRAASPLMTLINPELIPIVTNSFLDIHSRQGFLPIWHFMSCETGCMVGTPGVIVLSDIILKGFNVDIDKCYRAIKMSLNHTHRGLELMREYGYIPCNMGQNESVSKTLENAVAYWAAARVAERLGNQKDKDRWDYLSKAYERIYDTRVGFFRGRRAAKFDEPLGQTRAYKHSDQFLSTKNFNPSHQTEEYTEGTPWQYLFMVPHDLDGLVELLGGKERFLSRLDSLFLISSELNENANPDISGMIGQYAHGNEPSHHILYFYNMLDKQEKGNSLLRRVMNELYTINPDGLCGNEDCGQMSAWYILSALGLYQVEPAGGRYWFGSPIINSAVIEVGNGKYVNIICHDNSAENLNVDHVLWNGHTLSTPYIMFSDLIKGGTLEFFMRR